MRNVVYLAVMTATILSAAAKSGAASNQVTFHA